MRWTNDQLEFYLARFSGKDGTLQISETPDPGPESKLQGRIEQWCRDWGRPCLSFHQSIHAKKLLPPGWPDMTIIQPTGKILFIELKSARGRLSDAQRTTKLQFLALGHTIHQIRSYKAFLRLIQQSKEESHGKAK